MDEINSQQSGSLEVEKHEFEPIKGYPMLGWKGKRPFRSTQYYPAQLKETHGEPVDGWLNKILWGDNLQVMSHLLKEYRGKVNLVYIDPPFDSKADYRKTVRIKGTDTESSYNVFEEKQYTDIWTNDEYLQFIYERLILIKELLSSNGSIYLHCDYHKSHLLRCLMDEIFGPQNFINEIIWKRRGGALNNSKSFGTITDTIFIYSKTDKYTFNPIRTKESEEAKKYIEERFVYRDEDGRLYSRDPVTNPSSNPSPSLVYEYKGYKSPAKGWAFAIETMRKWDKEGRLYFPSDKSKRIRRKTFLDEYEGQPVQNLWTDIHVINSQANEYLDYPTQKPESLIERIIKTSSNEGDLVFDCFMGSGTTQAVALKLGRRFIGSDINLGAVQTTTKRLISVLKDNNYKLPGFEVYNVNNYEVFRNPVQAKELLVDALEIQPLTSNGLYDGEKDGRMVKIMPVNRIATKADLNELITNFDYKLFEKRQQEHPTQPVEKLLLVCMGHEPDLAATLEQETGYKLDVEVVDILRDKSNLEFRRDSEADITIDNGKLNINNFYPMNLLQKLSIMKENVDNWKELVESIMIDWNYDGAVLEPAVVDIPEKDGLVKGVYDVPEDAGTIRVKITDLLSETLEVSMENG
ncbi:site-specific DNA-methyltransferase [Alteribacillus bidgolensis]|uniref:Site-specific DNA-methyltransferase (Adenine-specific)/adenine-specific DNA-methyltransferase n=1 Tax=Alteribacillus bidgolensis TaxID=930129 RepID=A0A1G8Q952_9BACI|nr:site-specific DNA-methyltransferase [Alteribacillus bidgolensis]SDJ00630.1 site-specific DNA-methyltransferase (adenine-specific)/adenine-specific DNA-methyltransferase [Alteribacillus bidgolensis]